MSPSRRLVSKPSLRIGYMGRSRPVGDGDAVLREVDVLIRRRSGDADVLLPVDLPSIVHLDELVDELAKGKPMDKSCEDDH
jgi:hypothetical protein